MSQAQSDVTNNEKNLNGNLTTNETPDSVYETGSKSDKNSPQVNGDSELEVNENSGSSGGQPSKERSEDEKLLKTGDLSGKECSKQEKNPKVVAENILPAIVSEKDRQGEKSLETGDKARTDSSKQEENPKAVAENILPAKVSEKDKEGEKLLKTGVNLSGTECSKQEDPGGSDERSTSDNRQTEKESSSINCTTENNEEVSFLDRNVTFRNLIMTTTITTVISFLFGAFCLHTSNVYLGYYGSDFSGNVSQEKDSSLQICLATKNEMTEKLEEIKTTIDKSKIENNGKLKDVLSENKMLHENYKKLNLNQNLMKGDQEFKAAKQVNTETFWLAVLVLGAAELLIFAIICRSTSTKVKGLTERPWQSTSQTRVISPPEIQGLDHITPRTLQNSVCVLSFYGGTPHNNHLTVSRSFLDQVRVEDFVVNRHEDILKIPNSKVVLVHVDYNARNIILEDPNREIGDLKRKTVLSLQKMGAVVIVFYYEEKSGRGSVDNGRLYNPQLESVKIHSVLKQLEAQQRVISLQEGAALTGHQKHHLKSSVLDILKSH